MGPSTDAGSPLPRGAARRLFPSPAVIAADEIYAQLTLPDGPPERPYVVVNMVSTADGKTALGGRAAGIGSDLDRTLMRQIRAAADGLMVGAGTLRAERVDPRVPGPLAEARTRRGHAAQPLAITLSRRLDLDPSHHFLRGGPGEAIIFTSAQAPPERVAALARSATIELVGECQVDMAAALAVLRTRHRVARLVVEGGPTLNQALMERGAVDELFWTIAPKLAAGSGPGLTSGPGPLSSIAAELSLVSLFECRSELFIRYRVIRGGAPAPSVPRP
ncbi:MAG TPA: dihydrofolate reductase family protein [Chloroflexota bacterium]|nr:dihydrofolate reductase family protein [Chloroflexota bacterium]